MQEPSQDTADAYETQADIKPEENLPLVIDSDDDDNETVLNDKESLPDIQRINKVGQTPITGNPAAEKPTTETIGEWLNATDKARHINVMRPQKASGVKRRWGINYAPKRKKLPMKQGGKRVEKKKEYRESETSSIHSSVVLRPRPFKVASRRRTSTLHNVSATTTSDDQTHNDILDLLAEAKTKLREAFSANTTAMVRIHLIIYTL
jgi:hypothetical protein